MQLYHDSRDSLYRNPIGACPCGTRVRIRLRVSAAPDACHLRIWFGKESFYPMQPTAGDPALCEVELTLPETPCLLWYDFQAWKNGQFYWYGNAEDKLGGVGAPVYGAARSYQITVYDPAFETPAWLESAVFYQIFPDRFAKSEKDTLRPMDGRVLHESWNEPPLPYAKPEPGENAPHDFFGGNLSGIREKLPYLKALGINALYLNPVFYAASNHRFDTMDWHQIDPYLGTEQDFIDLAQAAAAHGIKIILDGVFNHAGSQNPFFQSAKKDALSPYRNWFLFESWPDLYKSWWGFQTLPEINEHVPEVIAYFLTGKDSVVAKWLRNGASGWRIDVADELPVAFLRLLRDAVKRAGTDHYLLGEVWEDASNKTSYGEMRSYCLGDTMDGVMNYPLRDAAIDFLLHRIDAAAFKRRVDSLYENYPQPFARGLLNIISSHDRPRILNTLSENEGEHLSAKDRAHFALSDSQYNLGKTRVKLMLSIIFAMPGVPCVYYGDEIGMQGTYDPFNRATYPWGQGDEQLFDAFQDAIARRKSSEALSKGHLAIQAVGSDALILYRFTKNDTCATVVNRGKDTQTVEINGQTIVLEGLSSVMLALKNPIPYQE